MRRRVVAALLLVLAPQGIRAQDQETALSAEVAETCAIASRFNVSPATCLRQVNLKDDIKHVRASGGSLEFYFPASTAESCRLGVAVALMSWREWTETKPHGINVSCRGYRVRAKFKIRESMMPSYFIEWNSLGQTVYKFYDSGEGM
jgi:hypothetical protein